MKIESWHSWQVSPSEAVIWQRRLANQVSRESKVGNIRFIAGADISAGKSGVGTVAVVVLSYPELNPVETKTIQGKLYFPYVPGLLSFREAPLVLTAFENLETIPDLFLVDGQGIAHPRRFGIASHLGLILDMPTIGCAKSLLCGEYQDPDNQPGSYSEIQDKNETIGAALRTKVGVKPVFVSIGHKIDLNSAIHRVLECCRGYRIPEPLRLAHIAAGKARLLDKKETVSV